jgi:hypothetical protein
VADNPANSGSRAPIVEVPVSQARVSDNMSLLGKAAMVAWYEVAPGSEAGHDEWHSRQHLFERVAIPGFRRGRRCRSDRGNEHCFIMYEVDDLSVLTSPAYLDRLNHPTEWSRRIIPTISNTTRTLCRVLNSIGRGVGTSVLTMRLAAEVSRGEELVRWMSDREIEELRGHRGVVGVHLLEGDDSASSIRTDEMRLRGGGDQIAALVLLVEGYSSNDLESLLDEQLAVARYVEHGAEPDRQVGIYNAAHIVTEADLQSGV